jgi:hypothetical protein
MFCGNRHGQGELIFFSQGFLLFSVLTVPVNSFRFLHYPEEANTVYFAANMIMPRYGNLG